jgi:hypothetical protein
VSWGHRGILRIPVVSWGHRILRIPVVSWDTAVSWKYQWCPEDTSGALQIAESNVRLEAR